MNTPSQNREVLHSWKEIATYLGFGVRTVQRYEVELRLPVRRVAGKTRSAVLALKGDLDTWVRNSPIRSAEPATGIQTETSISKLRELSYANLGDNSNKMRETIALEAHRQALYKLDCNVRKLLEEIAEAGRIRSRMGWSS